MAIITEYICTQCGEHEEAAIASGAPIPSLCYKCQEQENDRKRREYFHGLDGLTIEERIRRIEEWIYDYKPSNRDVRY